MNLLFTFGEALHHLYEGEKVTRQGWNGKGMFIFLVYGSEFEVNREPLLSILGHGTKVKYNPHIDIKQADGSISTWSPSNGDSLAEDWMFFEEDESTSYQGRMSLEAKELDIKLQNLVKFLTHPAFRNLSALNQSLMIDQREAMTKYLAVLNLRIEQA